MQRFQHLVFVCTNSRDESDKRGSCAGRGSQQLLDRLKALVKEHRLQGKVRVVACGCLDYCSKGCVVLALSDLSAARETWYTRVKAEDAEALFQQHILQGEPLETLVEPVKG